jgi:hypothetical protein
MNIKLSLLVTLIILVLLTGGTVTALAPAPSAEVAYVEPGLRSLETETASVIVTY